MIKDNKIVTSKGILFSEIAPEPVVKEGRNVTRNKILSISLGGNKITKEVTTLGRTHSLKADIPVEITSVSRCPHATVQFEDGQFYIKDENSSNGTFILKKAKKIRLGAGERRTISNKDHVILAGAEPMLFEIK